MRLAYDIEVFPNLFTAIFFDLDRGISPKSASLGKGIATDGVYTFVYAPEFGLNDLWQLKDFLAQDNLTLFGFNNLYYDEPVLDYVLSKSPKPNKIFEFSSNLIARLNGKTAFNYTRYLEWDSVDLMKLMAFDAQGVSLKQASINLKWHRVQDLPFEFDKIILEDEIPIVVDYNLNDVLITAELFYAIADRYNLRVSLSSEYEIDLRSASDSRMANLILNHIYTRDSGLHIDDFYYSRTSRNLVWLRNCIGKGIKFKTKKLQSLKRKIMNTVVVNENNFSFGDKIEFGNCIYNIGVGGLHSDDKPAIFESDDNFIIQDADVGSYYPNIILVNNIIPKHLDFNFIKILDKITKERLDAKKKGNKVKADGLKITVNSIFGKLNSDTYWLQDAKSMLSVTLSGQLYLLMLIEDLMINGIMTISANTDGIVCRIPKSKLEKYYEICENWQNNTGFTLEYTQYKRYVRTDVNNYLTIKTNNNVKEKGRYLREIMLNRGFRYPIIPEAMYQYWVNGIPVMETLKKHNDILDFCISQKAGKKFGMELHETQELFGNEVNAQTQEEKEKFLRFLGWTQSISNNSVLWFPPGNNSNENIGIEVEAAFESALEEYKELNTKIEITKLQKNNRFFVSTSGGKLIKRNRDTGGTSGLYVSNLVTILNDYDENKPISEYPVDYDFYEEEALKYIRDINNSEFNFDFISEEISHVDDINTDELVEIAENVKILPPQFRHSSGTYLYDEKQGVIYRGIAQINYLTDETGEKLYSIRDMKFDSWFDFLIYNKINLGLNTRQVQTLIKINFFKEFGKNQKLLTVFDKFAKIYKPEQTQKTIDKKTALLKDLWNNTPNKSFSIKKQILTELEILGFVQSKWNMPKTLFVMNLNTTYSPKLDVYSLSKGNTARVKIQKNIFNSTLKIDGSGKGRTLELGDFIEYYNIEKKPAVRKGDGKNEWIPIPDKYDYWITDYEIL